MINTNFLQEILIKPTPDDLKIYKRMGLDEYVSPTGARYPLNKPKVERNLRLEGQLPVNPDAGMFDRLETMDNVQSLGDYFQASSELFPPKSRINRDFVDSLAADEHPDVQENKVIGFTPPFGGPYAAGKYKIGEEPEFLSNLVDRAKEIGIRTTKQAVNAAFIKPVQAFLAKSGPGELDTLLELANSKEFNDFLKEPPKRDEQGQVIVDLSKVNEFATKAQQKVMERVAKSVPEIKLPPPESTAEKGADLIGKTVGGIGGFLLRLWALKRFLGTGGPARNTLAWELENELTGGTPGAGAATQLTLSGISKIPTVTKAGKATKMAAGGGFFGGITLASGGSTEEVITNTLIGVGFQAWDIHKQNQFLKKLKTQLRQTEYVKAQKAINEGNRQAKLEYQKDLKAGMKATDAKAKYQRNMRDATRIGERMLKTVDSKINKAMDVVTRKLHHGKLEGREKELAKKIVEKGITPEVAAEVSKLEVPTKGRKELARKGYVEQAERLLKLRPQKGAPAARTKDTHVVLRDAEGRVKRYYPAGTTFEKIPKGWTTTKEAMPKEPTPTEAKPAPQQSIQPQKPAEGLELPPKAPPAVKGGIPPIIEPEIGVEKPLPSPAEKVKKGDLVTGALPSMAEEVRETAIEQILAESEMQRNFIGDKTVKYWLDVRDEYYKIKRKFQVEEGTTEDETRHIEIIEGLWEKEEYQEPKKEEKPLTKPEEERIISIDEREKAQVEKRPAGVREAGVPSLEEVPPEVVPTPEEEGGAVRPTVRGRPAGRKVHDEGTGRPEVQPGDGLSSSGGSSTKDVDTSARRGPTLRRRTEDLRADYRITEADQIGKGGPKTKYRNNVATIKLLKQIESENRPATSEEQASLVKYVGWGGMPQVFNYYDKDWEKEYRELKEILTDEEYAAARASTPNAHYTSFDTISGMWEGLIKLGFKGGRINEPSMGVGHFYGLMPDSIASQSKLFGVELDQISGKIAKQLYQSADIQVKGFEKTKYPDDFFDLFISNVPFGNYKIYDEEMRKINFSIHDFFFAKALKKTRPGGLVVFITSKSTMDKLDSTVRSYISQRADLVGAIRLPNTAFKENANTEVVTDILIFQKREAKKFPAGEKFKSLGEITEGEDVFTVNEYFVRNPQNILGKLSLTGTMYRAKELTVEPKGLNLAEEIRRIIGDFKPPEDINAKLQKIQQERFEPGYSAPAPDHVKENAYVVDKGILQQNIEGTLLKPDLPKPIIRRIKELVSVRDALRDLLHKQIDKDQSEKEIEKARKKFNTVYHSTVKSYGPLSGQYNQNAFRDDPDLPMLLSLETYDTKKKAVTKLAEIFTKRTQFPYKIVEHAENAEQALVVSLAEKGRVDLDYMSVLLDKSLQEVTAELSGRIFLDPEGLKWVTADMYLSGNVRRKLETAKEIGKTDKRFTHNVEALEKVQPEDLSPVDIDARLGATWIDEEDYGWFYAHLTGSRGLRFRKVTSEGTWVKEGQKSWGTAETDTWGTDWFGASKLMIMAMNQKQPTAYDKVDDKKVVNQEETVAARVKQQQLKDKFKEWIWEDDERATRLARKYNDTYNNTVFPEWDGSHLTLPGKVDDSIVKLRHYQLNGVWRYLTSGNTLFAHQVGAGKTYTGIAIAMEARRLGLAKKPIFVVPNHLVTQWRDSWMKLYPSATILFATSDDFKPKNRQTLMNRISTGDWDGVIVPMSSFEKIPMAPDVVRAFYEEQLTALEMEMRSAQEDRNRNLTKELEKAKNRLKATLERQEAKWKKDVGPYFNEMGIDMLFVDEAQEFKNLYFRTQMNRVPGIAQSFVQKSFDMEMKTKYINRITDNKGIAFATGTPITNSVTEMFTVQRYLQPGLLEEKSLEAFDFWAQNFGETVTAVEVAPDGSGFRVHTRFAKFTNLPELMQMFRMVTDIQTQKMLNLDVPDVKGGKAAVIRAPETDELKSYVQTLVKRAEDIRTGHVDPRDDNMLKVTNDGRKAALDLRLVIPGAADSPTSKVNMLVDKVHEIWKDTKKDKSTQVIWCDLSTPKPGRWSIYDDVKRKLIKKGVPVSEIAFIHDVKNKKDLDTFYRKINRGDIRIVMASTFKMGTGANIQERLLAAHHLAAPWRPADIEQRDGRIIRQGNSNNEVQIYRYVTKGSFDAYMWQTLETKAKFIEQVMSGETTSRETEDVGDTILSYAEVKALASGNPKVMQAVQLESDIVQLKALERAFRNQHFKLKKKSAEVPLEIEYQEKRHKATSADAQKYAVAKEKAGKDLDFTFDKHYTKRKEAGEALLGIIDKLNKLSDKDVKVGSAYGFDLTAKWVMGLEQAGWWRITIKGKWLYETDLEESAVGNITRIQNTFESISQTVGSSRALADRYKEELSEIQAKIGQPFEKTEELKEKQKHLTQLQQEIGLDKKDEPTIEVLSPSGGFVGGRPATAKVSAIVKEDMSTGSKKADAFLRRTKGFTGEGQPGILRKSFSWAIETFKGFHYLQWLPKLPEYADIREHFRHTEEIKRLAWNAAVEKMRWAMKPIEGVKQELQKRFQALEMKIVADDLMEDVENDLRLPPELSEEDVLTMKLKADQLYDKYPSVREAYDRVRQVTQEVGNMLVEEGMLEPEKAKEFYFPHRVIKYLRTEDAFFGIPTRKPAQYKPGYLKQRKGGYDYSTDIMERLVEHWAQVQRDVAYRQFLESVLKEEQENWFRQEYPEWKQWTKDDEGNRVRNLIPEGYKEVTVLPGRYYYSTYGVTEDMAKAIINQNLNSIEEMFDEKTASQIRKVLALGKKRSYIVREPIARQLYDMPTRPISRNPAYLAVKGFHTFVKGQILFNPLYSLPFHITNFIGDAHKVLVALPSALKSKYLANYWKEIINAHRGEKSERFELAQKYGVVGSGWIGVDITELKTIMPEIEKAEISGAAKHFTNKAKRLWNLSKKVGQGREDWLRYALFDRLMDLTEHGEDVTKYAIKDSPLVKEITDPQAKAAKVARDIAGDYTAIGKTGRMLSDVAILFYRWMHLNLPWWPRMVKEYLKKGQYSRLIYALLAAAAPYIISTIWNYSDEERRKYEQSLPHWKRWNFHIVGLHGKRMYYTPLPLDDVLNFVGVPEDILDIQRYQRGMINAPELVKRLVINSTYEPGMSVVNAIGGLPAVVRDAIGWRTFPDFKDYREKDWKRKGLNISGDIFGAPGQLGKALHREGVRIDDDGNIVLGQKTQDTLDRAWMGIRPYSVDLGKVQTLKRKSTYKQTQYPKSKGIIKGKAHKGKQRLVDSLKIQLEK